MKTEQLNELIYQMLETERGGMQVYETALRCVVNDELKEEWEKYLDQTKSHERIVLELMDKLGLDPARETPGRGVVRLIGESLVAAMEMARKEGSAEAAIGAPKLRGGRTGRRTTERQRSLYKHRRQR